MKRLTICDVRLPIGRLLKALLQQSVAKRSLELSKKCHPGMNVNRQLEIGNRQSTYASA